MAKKGILTRKYIPSTNQNYPIFTTSPIQAKPPEESELLSLGDHLFILYRPEQRRVWEVISWYDPTQTDAKKLDERLEDLGLMGKDKYLLQHDGFTHLDKNARARQYGVHPGKNLRTSEFKSKFSEDTAHLIVGREGIELSKPLEEWYGGDKLSFSNEMRRIISEKQ
ncbi:MAG: hypothetical protein O2779_03040 [Nanoarchaeota archaeon]|nr:hypothetical protein [Nanoarchaeota archaeon]